MSIYPVKLSEWFPFTDEMYFYAKTWVDSSRCLACGKKMRYSKAIGHHSIPWGYGDVWCSWKCCRSGKVAKPDYRRQRRLKRKYYPFDMQFIKVNPNE